MSQIFVHTLFLALIVISTVQLLNPRKYRYSKAFADLVLDNTHIVVIVLFGFGTGENNEPIPNNYIVTAYQKEIG